MFKIYGKYIYLLLTITCKCFCDTEVNGSTTIVDNNSTESSDIITNSTTESFPETTTDTIYIEDVPKTDYIKDKYIQEGLPAVKNSWLFIAVVTYKQRFVCSGSLIHPLWIITAAHCLPINTTFLDYAEFYDTIGVSIGPAEITAKLINETTRLVTVENIWKIDKYIIHPDYHKRVFNEEAVINDIALVKLSEDFKPFPKSFTTLATEPIKDGTSCLTAGWGVSALPSIYVNETTKHVLYELVLYMTQYGCDDIKEKSKIILKSVLDAAKLDALENVICSIADIPEETPFRVDSGSPLICDGKLYGIASVVVLKNMRNMKKFLAAYTKIVPYNDWIQDIISKETQPFDTHSDNQKVNPLPLFCEMICLIICLNTICWSYRS